jgi:hypothetical protein
MPRAAPRSRAFRGPSPGRPRMPTQAAHGLEARRLPTEEHAAALRLGTARR